ncbi:Uncharacterized protein HZ326_29572 [Fusarium oxysporum f. sp. albedinis]|nr:Uncharacterized protein HZ326_29572 [Fusarium oxysporum f. sp. albedinis]
MLVACLRMRYPCNNLYLRSCHSPGGKSRNTSHLVMVLSDRLPGRHKLSRPSHDLMSPIPKWPHKGHGMPRPI